METLGAKATVTCTNSGCPQHGDAIRVPLFSVVRGVAAKPGFVWTGCFCDMQIVQVDGVTPDGTRTVHDHVPA